MIGYPAPSQNSSLVLSLFLFNFKRFFCLPLLKLMLLKTWPYTASQNHLELGENSVIPCVTADLLNVNPLGMLNPVVNILGDS